MLSCLMTPSHYLNQCSSWCSNLIHLKAVQLKYCSYIILPHLEMTFHQQTQYLLCDTTIFLQQIKITLIARFMEPTCGQPEADRSQVGPILAPWTLLSGYSCLHYCSEFQTLQRTIYLTLKWFILHKVTTHLDIPVRWVDNIPAGSDHMYVPSPLSGSDTVPSLRHSPHHGSPQCHIHKVRSRPQMSDSSNIP